MEPEPKLETAPQPSDAQRVWQISIISSLVASAIFLVFLQPILHWIGAISVKFVGSASKSLLDVQFSQAALGSSRATEFITLGWVTFIFVFIIVMLLFTLSLILYMQDLRKNNPEKFESRVLRARKLNSTIMIAISAFCAVAVVVVTSMQISGAYVSMQAETTFDVRLRILSPYLSEQTEEEIVSRWSTIRGRSDYENLMSEMDTHAKTHQIKLPNRLI